MPQNMPKVSVLMPAYNAEKYIGEAIESILNQTLKDFEFIIVNDGSTDDTVKIVRKYADGDERIKLVDNKENRGLIAVLNQGLDLCKGEYIARMDSDDISLPERFEKQVEYLDKHRECGVVGSAVRIFGAKSGGHQNPPCVKLFDLLIHGSKVTHPSVMMRASVLRDNGIYYDSQYPHAEDFAFWISIVRVAEIHNLPEVLLNYRWHNTNISVVHRKTQVESTERARRNLLKSLITNEDDITKLLDLTRESDQHFWLSNLLPIIKRKRYSLVKTKYYLFEKIPLLKEKDGKIYLFEFIKIGTFR